MQISSQEVGKLQQTTTRPKTAEQPVETVADLAAKYQVRMDEVRRVVERMELTADDVARERRVQELAKRVADGQYAVGADQVVDMAERRAIADRSDLG